MKMKKIIAASAALLAVGSLSIGAASLTVSANGTNLAGFEIAGASIRTANPVGMRFITEVPETIKDSYTFGTLIIPKADLGEATLDINTAKALNIETSKWQEKKKNKPYTYASVLGGVENGGSITDFPKSQYNAPIVARSYAKDDEGNVVDYTETVERSLAGVASMALADTTDEGKITVDTQRTFLNGICDYVLGEDGFAMQNVSIAGTDAKDLSILFDETNGNEGLTAIWSVVEGDAIELQYNAHGIATTMKVVGEGSVTLQATIGSFTETVTVNVGRKIFACCYSTTPEPLSVEGYISAEQQAYAVTDGIVFAQFNATPSKTYYAEYTVASEVEARMLFGITHSVKGDPKRWLTAYTASDDLNGRDMITRDIDIADINDFDKWVQAGHYQYKQEKIAKRRDLYAGESAFPVKLATARIGDFFYIFVNDEYVCGYTNAYFADKDTVPGIFGKNIKKDAVLGDRVTHENKTANTVLKNFDWLTGDAAQNKFDELTDHGTKIMSAFVPFDSFLESKNTDGRRFVYGEYSEQNGVNIDYVYDLGYPGKDGAIGPYLYFDGDFSFEFTYELTSYGMDNGNYKYTDHRLQAFVSKASEPSGVKHELSAYFYGKGKHTYFHSSNDIPDVKGLALDSTTFIPKNTISFKIVRTGKVYSVSLTENGEDGVSLHHRYMGEAGPVLVRLDNVGIAGKYTDISWGVPGENEIVKVESVSITNKEKLTEKWMPGDADRTIEFSLSPDIFNPSNTDVTVTSGNPDVVEVGEGGLPSGSFTFNIKRVGASVTVTENIENGKIATATFECANPISFLMQNVGIAGKFTNIRWSVPIVSGD